MSLSLHRLRPPRRSNEALDEPLTSEERIGMIAAATRKFEEPFDILQMDHRCGHNTRDTPARVARMLVDETMAGRFAAPPATTALDDLRECATLERAA